MKYFFLKQVAVAAIVLVGIVVFVGLMLITGNNYGTLFTPSNTYKSIYKNIDGIHMGSEVTIHGNRTGNVIQIKLLKSGMIELTYTVKKSHNFMVNKSSYVILKSKGMLGDRYINIITDNLSAQSIPEQSVIPTKQTASITSALASGRSSMEDILSNISQITDKLNKGDFLTKKERRALTSTIMSLDSILKKVDRGNGSLGAIINNRSLYNKMLIFLGAKPRDNYLKDLSKKSRK